MDIITALNVFIIALVAIFFPFMELSKLQVKRYLLTAAILFIVPLVFALAGNSFGWFTVYYFEDVILLQRGVFGICFAVGYGIVSGLVLYAVKVMVMTLLGRKQQD